MTRRLVTLLSALFVVVPTAAFAQDSNTEQPPAHVSFVEGTVVLERDGERDDSPASMPLLAGDRLRTVNGRAEVLFADGSTLHIDRQSTVDFQSDEVLRLIDGRVRLATVGRSRELVYRVDAPGGWVQISVAGEYRIAVLRAEREPQVELAVLRGSAELVNEDGRSIVRAGERSFARAGAQPSPPYVFNSAAWDDFDRWSESRRDERLGASAEYLPADVRPYASTFDQYGSWQYEQPYGHVWYPRAYAGWRPYYRGRWVSLRPYGWTWIGGDPWGWPTHHYGRWGFSGSSWFWIPGRHWGAAWVSWGYAPGYVSWCPLGWNNRPVFSLVNVNIYGGRHYDGWHGWNVVPRRHFGYGYANTHIVAGHRLDGRTRGAFVVRDSSPDWQRTVPRASTPIRTAGTRDGSTRPRTGSAVPRGFATSSPSATDVRPSVESSARGFPAPARQPRTPGSSTLSRSGSVTPAPQRAVPRDRRVEPDSVATPGRTGAVTVPGTRVSPQRRDPTTTERDSVGPTAPPAGTRAVPRRAPDVAPPQSAEPDSGRYDRPPDRPTVRTDQNASPQQPQPWGGGSYRRGGDRTAPDGGVDRYRAVPRQDAPRSTETPRSYQAPRPPEAPRSYDAPRATPRSESRPPSDSGAAERRGSAPSSADRPSRPSGGGGEGSRSRGDRPSQGQGSRRPGG